MIIGVLYADGRIEEFDRFGELFTIGSADARVSAECISGRSAWVVASDDGQRTWGLPVATTDGNVTQVTIGDCELVQHRDGDFVRAHGTWESCRATKGQTPLHIDGADRRSSRPIG